jgi:hypothetical protein
MLVENEKRFEIIGAPQFSMTNSVTQKFEKSDFSRGIV